LKTIVVTGPESTGKSLISEYLSNKLDIPWIPEYAREYISEINRPYTYSDVEHIAKSQILQLSEKEQLNLPFLILDTWLIITKVWFEEVFGKYPAWIDIELANHKIDLYLVCIPDIPWIPDPVRENGGEKREYLLSRYLEEIKKTGSNFVLISGVGESRYNNALFEVKKHFKIEE
jgi:nicotinamide riboside kinase